MYIFFYFHNDIIGGWKPERPEENHPKQQLVSSQTSSSVDRRFQHLKINFILALNMSETPEHEEVED